MGTLVMNIRSLLGELESGLEFDTRQKITNKTMIAITRYNLKNLGNERHFCFD